MIKDKLYQHCINTIEESIDNFQKAIDNAQAAANEEGKSSAGDKYETGRAMMQLEIEKNTAQLLNSKQMLYTLQKTKDFHSTEFVHHGSLVKTTHGMYYLSIGLGIVKLENEVFYVISDNSPIGVLLKGKKIGEQFKFNGRTFFIETIE